VDTEAKYVADMQGSFEVRPCLNGRAGRCLQQVAPKQPIIWQGGSDAYTLAGDTAWRNYTVSVDVNLQQAGVTKLIGRANTQARPQSRQAGYELRVADTGDWTLAANDTNAKLTTLASGTTTALGLHSWHTLALTMVGTAISARIDNRTVAQVTDATYAAGEVGFGVVGYQTNQFDNLTVTPGPASTGG